MRTLPAVLALVLLACAPTDRGDSETRDAGSRRTSTGPDPVVLRIPRAGGPATAYVYPRLDSVVWQSPAPLPPIARVLGFDPEGGLLAFVDSAGDPGRLDLRVGAVHRQADAGLRALASADGVAIYGVDRSGKVVRLTPAGEAWTLTPPSPARAALPQADGWLLVVGEREDETLVWRLHPPESRIVDTLSLPRTTPGVRAHVLDRLYLAADERLLGVRSQGLEPVPGVSFDGRVTTVAATPSGDRVFVVTDSSDEIAVVDRYEEDVTHRVDLPGPVSALRVDPLGRYLLARPARGDSAWIVSLSSGEHVGTVATGWRDDLPLVAPDGAIAVARGEDVVFLSGGGWTPGARVAGGAADFWHTLSWSGFRPRAGDIDDPVRFPTRQPDPAPAPPSADSTPWPAPAPYDTIRPPAADSAAPPPRPMPPPPRPVPNRPITSGFYVSFAALLDAARARELAAQITVDGQRAKVVEGQQAGTTIHRVLLGPFADRAEADRVGRASGRTYFILEGAP